ncbi:MAG: J domain-containing protein [Betaproteobacteria bacterium]|nr:J domain-containing protein [Betaproteobacteria bacterium]
MKDYYGILGLQPTATLAEVKSAYRRKASALHPDRNPSERAHSAFQEVQAAYEVLSNTDKRRAFDDNRRRSLIENPIDTAREIWSAYLKHALR